MNEDEMTAREWFQRYGSSYPNRAERINICAEELDITKRGARRVMVQLEREYFENPTASPLKAAKILLVDIETSPMEVYVWSLKVYDKYISPSNVIKDWAILSWAAKWLCDGKVMSAIVSPKDAIKRQDSKLIKPLWELLNEADIVIAFNAWKFDLRKINTRFLVNDLPPPMPYQVIDPLREARKHFAFSSNKLDYINEQLELSRKMDTSFSLWKRCVTGDGNALLEMEEYNRKDVVVLEDNYFTIRPWIKSHPNLSLFVETDEEACPTCNNPISEEDWGGYYTTPSNRFRAFRCSSCGAIGRSRFTDLDKKKRKKLVVSTAR